MVAKHSVDRSIDPLPYFLEREVLSIPVDEIPPDHDYRRVKGVDLIDDGIDIVDIPLFQVGVSNKDDIVWCSVDMEHRDLRGLRLDVGKAYRGIEDAEKNDERKVVGCPNLWHLRKCVFQSHLYLLFW